MIGRRSTAQALRWYLQRVKAETVFTPAELTTKLAGSSEAVRQALTRLVRSGHVHRISKGYYTRANGTEQHPSRKPSHTAIAKAYRRKKAIKKHNPYH